MTPSVLTARIDPAKLYPPFYAALSALLRDASDQGADFYAISGFRTYGEQMALWQQGRVAKGPIVTHAKGGESTHNFGIAVDLCRDGVLDRRGLQPDYAPESYEILRELAPAYGLLWGGSWKFPDRPHVQMPHWVTARDLEPLRHCYELAGLVSVFQFLDLGASHV